MSLPHPGGLYYYRLLGAESTSILIFNANSPSCSAWHSLRNSSPFSSLTGLCLRYLQAEHGWLSSITYYQNKVTSTNIVALLLVQCMCSCMCLTHLLPLLGRPHTNCRPSVVHRPHCLTHERLTSYLHSYHVTCSLQHTTCWCEHTA